MLRVTFQIGMSGEGECAGRQQPEKAYSSRKICRKLKDASISIKRVLGHRCATLHDI